MVVEKVTVGERSSPLVTFVRRFPRRIAMPFSGAEFLPTQSIQSVLGLKSEPDNSTVPPPASGEYSCGETASIYRPTAAAAAASHYYSTNAAPSVHSGVTTNYARLMSPAPATHLPVILRQCRPMTPNVSQHQQLRVIQPPQQSTPAMQPPPPQMGLQVFAERPENLVPIMHHHSQYGPMDDGLVGETSTKTYCKHCQKYVRTIIKREVGQANFLAAALACICLPCSWFGCQCIPFFVEDWKDAVHYCDNCGRKIGAYNSLAQQQQ